MRPAALAHKLQKKVQVALKNALYNIYIYTVQIHEGTEFYK